MTGRCAISLHELSLVGYNRVVDKCTLPTCVDIHCFVRHYTPCLKNCAKLFLSEPCQISTNCEKFWHKDGKKDKLIRVALIFHFI